MTMIPPKFYRLPENGVLTGLLAGVAESFEINLKLLRIGFVIAVLCGFFPLLVAYFLLSFFVPEKRVTSFTPGHYSKWFEKGGKYDSSADSFPSYGDVLAKQKRNLDRLQRLESYLVSSTYELDREYAKLEVKKHHE